MRTWGITSGRFWLALGALAAVAYIAWPLSAGFRLRQAVRNRDVAALEARVDWPALRANLKPRLDTAIAESAAQSGVVGSAVKRALGSMVAGPAVSTMVTPANLGRILAGRAFVLKRLPGTAPPANGGADSDDPMPSSNLRWAFFETPTRFRIEAVQPRLAPSRIGAILALEGWSWKLIDVEIVKR